MCFFFLILCQVDECVYDSNRFAYWLTDSNYQHYYSREHASSAGECVGRPDCAIVREHLDHIRRCCKKCAGCKLANASVNVCVPCRALHSMGMAADAKHRFSERARRILDTETFSLKTRQDISWCAQSLTVASDNTLLELRKVLQTYERSSGSGSDMALDAIDRLWMDFLRYAHECTRRLDALRSKVSPSPFPAGSSFGSGSGGASGSGSGVGDEYATGVPCRGEEMVRARAKTMATFQASLREYYGVVASAPAPSSALPMSIQAAMKSTTRLQHPAPPCMMLVKLATEKKFLTRDHIMILLKSRYVVVIIIFCVDVLIFIIIFIINKI